MAFTSRFSKGKITQCKRLAFEKLKNTGLEYSGTIFGGFVRDEYISEYYTNKYNKDHSNDNNKISKYWDAKYSPETSSRLLIPSDMDISFKTQQEADEFIAAVQNIPEFSKVSVNRENINDYYRSIQSSLESIQRVCIDMHFGREPFLHRGRLIRIGIDVVIPYSKTLEAPFGNLDMLCNGFILTKEGKRFSKNTGTIIDMYTDYERAVVTPQIIRDMLDFKTYICMANRFERQTINITAFNRILKITSKNKPWTILNMPYTRETYKLSDSKEECCICSDEFANNDEIAYTSIQNDKNDLIATSAKMHNRCLMRYLLHQKNDYDEFNVENPNKVFCFKCPMRNTITFTRCKLDIQFAYKTEM